MAADHGNRATGDHFYTLDFKGELAPWSGYEREDLDCFVYANPLHNPPTVPVHRWYKHNTTMQDHFYTTDASGEAAPHAGYVYEGIAFYLFATQQPDTVALNRWFHPRIGDHFYTTHSTGEAAPAAGYVREGITGYVYTKPLHGSVQLWRWYHSRKFRFTFDRQITDKQRQIIWERHTWAYYRAGKCTHLTQVEKDKVRHIYERDTIHHGIETRPGVNASAWLNLRIINVNFDVLVPQGDDEIAMSLLHEMMHCAGYDHLPLKPDPEYFKTTPLRAERCIAGFASDVASPAVLLAHGEMNEDGSLMKKPLITPADVPSSSGCRVLKSGERGEAGGLPQTPSLVDADTANRSDGSITNPLSTPGAPRADAADSERGSDATKVGAVDVDPYAHLFKMDEAVGLAALRSGT